MAIKVSEASLSLAGKVALVTGGGTGIGRGIALEFARAGADVAVSGRRSAPLDGVVEEIKGLGRKAVAVVADVSKKAEVDDMIRNVAEQLGEIDVLVNNAATGGHGPNMIDSDEERWDEVIDTNLKSVYLCCHAAAPAMIKRGSGNIINISSIASMRDARGARLYGIAKAGVNFLTRGLALDMGPHNVRVNCIAPGAIKTEMLEKSIGDEDANWTQLDAVIPLGRVGQPVDIATTAVFLASDASNYLTAQTITVDGAFNEKV